MKEKPINQLKYFKKYLVWFGFISLKPENLNQTKPV